MNDLRFGAALRAMRIRRGWRQRDVAAAAGVSDSTVSRIERGALDGLQLRSIRAVAAALDVSVEVLPRSRAAMLDRVANEVHARLSEHVVRWLAGLPGWIVRPEISFSRYGERGVIDLLAWHAATRSLLVIELKTEIVDVGELLGSLDRKLRNARLAALDLGWSAQVVSGLLVIGESDVNRRRVAAHLATFSAAFPERIVGVRQWLARPVGAIRGLIFFSDRRKGQATVRVATIRRVRSPRTRSGPKRRERGDAGEQPPTPPSVAGSRR